MVEYQGGCHCGRVAFRVAADPTETTVLECNCSYCAKRGILHWIVDASQFELIRGGDAVTTYQFNTRTAEHYFCETCGVQSFYRPRSHPDGISVNARCVDDVALDALTIEPFDGQNWEASIGELRSGEDTEHSGD
jgi:hypothetical protein